MIAKGGELCVCGRFAVVVVDDLPRCASCAKVALGRQLGGQPITYLVDNWIRTRPTYLEASPVYFTFRKETTIWMRTIL